MSRVEFEIAVFSLVLLGAPAAVCAQAPLNTANALITVSATGVVSRPNDQAYLTLNIEEQDKDKSAAASRVNRKMKQGVALMRHEDPQALLTTRGYYTYPVYPDQSPPSHQDKLRRPLAWRVGEYLDMRTSNLAALPKTVASSQDLLSLVGLQFGLSEAASMKLDARLIAAAYANLTERIAAIAKAMGRNLSDAVLESADFEGSGNYVPKREVQSLGMMRASANEPTRIEQPGFEPGETSLDMRLVARVRFNQGK